MVASSPRGLLAAFALSAVCLVLTPAALGDYVLADNPPVEGNPVERHSGRPLEKVRGYFAEAPKRCSKATPRGVSLFARWLAQNARRGTVGSRFRCEDLGGGNGFSFHSEGRAVDFMLDAGNPADAAEAERLIRLLLARDSKGRGAALARRMGVMEIIWDCGYWTQSQVDEESGATATKPYFMCPNADAATAHRNHVHFSLTRGGAAGATSFWWSLRKWAPGGAPVKSCPRLRERDRGYYYGYRRLTVSPKSLKCSEAKKVVRAMVDAEDELSNDNKFIPPEGVVARRFRCWDPDPDTELVFEKGTAHRERMCGNAKQTIGVRH